MDEYRYEQLTSILLEKISTLESVNKYYLSENEELKEKNNALRKQIEEGVHVSVTIKEEK